MKNKINVLVTGILMAFILTGYASRQTQIQNIESRAPLFAPTHEALLKAFPHEYFTGPKKAIVQR